MHRALGRFFCVLGAACGGRIALEAPPPPDERTKASTADAAVVPAPLPTTTPNDPALPFVTAPDECVRTEAPASIIAGGCRPGTCTSESIEAAVRHCPCGSYRLKVRGSNCIEAVESWEQSVACVAGAVLGTRFCSIETVDEQGCVDLSIPCGG